MPATPQSQRRHNIECSEQRPHCKWLKEHFGGITMRIGFIGSARIKLMELVAFAAAIGAMPIASHAQPPYGGNGPTSGGPVQAIYMESSGRSMGQQSSYTDSYGNPLIVPASYCQQCGGRGCGACCGGYNGCNGGCYGGCNGCNGGGNCGPGHGHGHGGGFNSCTPMGCGGTDPPIGYDLMNDVGIEGDLVDQRGPHYFDIRAEAVYLNRDVTFEESIDLTSLNVGNTIVLNTNQLEFDEQAGFRIIGRYDICPLAVVEFGYTGIFGWEDSASVTDPTNNLYSLWSRPAPGTGLFGTDPVGVNIAGRPESRIGAGVEAQHLRWTRICNRLKSATADTGSVTCHGFPARCWPASATRGWTTNFEFRTQGSEPATNDPGGPLAALRYNEECENNLAGFQTGGDIWICLCQGLRFGSEAKGRLVQQPLHAGRTKSRPRRSAPRRRRCSRSLTAITPRSSAKAASTWWQTFCRACRCESVTRCCSSIRSCWPAIISTRLRRTETKARACRSSTNDGAVVLPRCPRRLRIYLVSNVVIVSTCASRSPDLAGGRPQVSTLERKTCVQSGSRRLARTKVTIRTSYSGIRAS